MRKLNFAFALMIVAILIVFSLRNWDAISSPSAFHEDQTRSKAFQPSGAVASVQPQAEWQKRLELIASEPEWRQSEHLEELAENFPEEQVVEALDQLKSDEPGTSGATLAQLLIRRWAQKAPAEAAQWIAGLPDNALAHLAFREVMIPWAEKDLVRAADWVKQLPENENKTEALLILGDEAAKEKKATLAISLVAGMPPSPERDAVLKYSVLQWATVSRGDALAWANQVPDPQLRETMLEKITIEYGIQNPAGAAKLLSNVLIGEESRENAAINIVRFWAPSAPADAAAWAQRLPDGELRDNIMANLVDVWGKGDSTGVALWLNQLPPSRSRDAAVSVYAPMLTSSSLDLAERWAAWIQDTTLRTETEEQVKQGRRQEAGGGRQAN